MFDLTWLSNTFYVNKAPRVTSALLMAVALTFLFQMLWLDGHPEIKDQLRFVPLRLTTALSSLDPRLWFSAGLSLVTNMFLHDGRSLLHLFGNMLGIFALGPAVEARLGGARFLALYMVAGMAGAFCHALLNPLDTIPLIGASGAVFGIGAAYMVLWWKEGRVFSLIMLFSLIPLPLSLTAPVAVGLRIAMEFVAIAHPKQGDLAAHWVHVGGFLAGIAVAMLYRYRILGKNLILPEYTAVPVPDALDLLRLIGRKITALAKAG